jgi:LacI family gluconate utilization system Gnt-I transcriptional repressor
LRCLALNAPGSVAAETLQRVREAIKRTGYVPNMLAGGLASSRSHLIATLVPTIASPVFQATWEALTETFSGAGYHVTFGQTGYGGAREDELINTMIARRQTDRVDRVMHSPSGRRLLIEADIRW